jgi:hypothetical protein
MAYILFPTAPSPRCWCLSGDYAAVSVKATELDLGRRRELWPASSAYGRTVLAGSTGPYVARSSRTGKAGTGPVIYGATRAVVLGASRTAGPRVLGAARKSAAWAAGPGVCGPSRPGVSGATGPCVTWATEPSGTLAVAHIVRSHWLDPSED